MNGVQLHIDFTARVENNQESNRNLQLHSDKFNRQCRKVYDLLMEGVRLTNAEALIKYGIGDVRRRVKDLRDFAGIEIQDRWIEGNGRKFKEYFIETKTPASHDEGSNTEKQCQK